MTEVEKLKEARGIVIAVRRRTAQKIIDDVENVAAWIPGLVKMQEALRAIDAAIEDEIQLEREAKPVVVASSGKRRRSTVG